MPAYLKEYRGERISRAFAQRGFYPTKWLEASSPQAILCPEQLAAARKSKRPACAPSAIFAAERPSTRGATAPQRAQRVNFVRCRAVLFRFREPRRAKRSLLSSGVECYTLSAARYIFMLGAIILQVSWIERLLKQIAVRHVIFKV